MLRELLSDHPWIGAEAWKAGVTYLCWHHGADYLPPMSHLIAVIREEGRRLESERPALPSPPVNVALEIDPSDPYSCTPEERERWAREDVQIRQWAARVTQTPPEAMARLSAEDQESLRWSDAMNASVANWPNLKPAERRAKEKRIAAEKAQVPALIEAARAKQRAYYASLNGSRYVVSEADRVREQLKQRHERSGPERIEPSWPGASVPQVAYSARGNVT